MQKAKKIEFTVSLAGFGSPNKEGKEGKYLYNQHVKAKNELAKNEGGSFLPMALNDNITFMKANGYKDGRGRVIKTSGDCIRHAIFDTVNNPATKEDITALIAENTSYVGLIRGYLNPSKTDTTTKRKSPLTVSDAELDNDAVSQLETHSSSGPRSDTSFFVKESLGKSHFTFTARLDLSELSVLACSDTLDRPCVRPDLQPLFEQKLSENGFVFKKVALCKKNSVQPEICYLFDDDTVNKFVNYLIGQIQKIDLHNATEYLEFESMKATVTLDDGTRKNVDIVNGQLAEKISVALQYDETSMDAALEAEQKVRDLLQQTKTREPKKAKKTKKSGDIEETK